MERDIIQEWGNSRHLQITDDISEKMIDYAGMIYESNQQFNLTGLKSKEHILTELIIKSIDPVRDIIVPRGTQFADIGSGAGIPGIPLAIWFGGISGTLIESNQKKADFIRKMIDRLGLASIEIVCERAEILGKDKKYRETFSWCFSRAFGKLYIAMEIGAPFVYHNGNLYIYSNDNNDSINEELRKHGKTLGLDIMSHSELKEIRLSDPGICFKKTELTHRQYPRKYAVIKREAGQIK